MGLLTEVNAPLRQRCITRPTLMFIGYIDDSGSTGGNLDDDRSRYQVIGGPLINGDIYHELEWTLAAELEESMVEGGWSSFEFHTSDMFHATGNVFGRIGKDKCHELLDHALHAISVVANCPIICSVVDKVHLRQQIFQSAKPVDMGFRLYLNALKRWMEQEEIKQNVLLIADEGQKDQFRKLITEAFYSVRGKLKPREPDVVCGEVDIERCIFDDIYFGDSRRSVGIQMADICCYFIARHLAKKRDAEGFFRTIESNIRDYGAFPEELELGPR